MQAIIETLFNFSYLIIVIILGIQMIKGANGNKQYKLFGIMTLLLGGGDAFHLLPRVYALWTTGIEANAVSLGFGKFVTSITMTIFYMILYQIWQIRYEVKEMKLLSLSIYVLAAVRIILCFLPQNNWMSADASVTWGIYRNIPFLILGLIIVCAYFIKSRKKKDTNFKYMWLAIVISFALYAPVVLWSDRIPLLGSLMIPKTCAYVWVVWMGYREFRTKDALSQIKEKQKKSPNRQVKI